MKNHSMFNKIASHFCTLFLILVVQMAVAQVQPEPAPANSREEYERNYQFRIKQTTLLGQYIPKDMFDAFRELDKLTDSESKAKFKSMNEADAEQKLLGRFGRWMIMNWGFYEGSRLSHVLKSSGVYHPDDMASFLIITYHRNLNKKELGIKELIIGYKDKRKKIKEAELKKGKVIEVIKKKG
jgi:hypothetical protein